MHPSPNPHLYTLPGSPSRAQVLDGLAATAVAFRAALEACSSAALTTAAPGQWSAFQTACHFRDAALVYSARFRFLIFNDEPFLPNYDEDNWVAATRDTPADLPAILDEVAASRADLMRVLTRLEGAAWQRVGRHELAGPVVLEDYVRHELAHERMHLSQIRDVLAGRP